MKYDVTVVIPAYNPDPALLKALHDSLCRQTLTSFEVVLVDDASTNAAAYDCFCDEHVHLVRQEENRGPAAARNKGAAAAASELLFFTDTDCELAPDALENAVAGLRQDPVIMGNTITRVKTAFGRAVALLGFPGGGILGFDKVWRVDAQGYTNSFSSCSLGFQKKAFDLLGGFDESFPVPGGEDTVLARQAVQQGQRIRYRPDVRVYHVEKNTFSGFIRWQLTRGRGNYHIKKRVPSVGGYLRLRIYTFKNSLLAAGPVYALPVLGLIFLSVYYQLKGMWLEKRAVENTRPHA